ncbi:hypothetical protein PMI07_000387 [Rhizobium sp. CF080]|nr:hypothetical protein PMI07_000387 [Rhizobium sp. CF080]
MRGAFHFLIQKLAGCHAEISSAHLAEKKPYSIWSTVDQSILHSELLILVTMAGA